MLEQYPITIQRQNGEVLDRVGNYESAESYLYGDIGWRIDNYPEALMIVFPMAPEFDMQVRYLQTIVEQNNDCWGTPVDMVVRSLF